jgi:hypothetical protein
MTGERGGRRWRRGLILTAGLTVLSLAGLALAANPNERDVKPGANPQDPDEIYEYEKDDNGNFKLDGHGNPIVKLDAQGNPVPKPDSKIWVLDFKFKDPRLIKVDVPGRGQKVCWYLWYQVINRTKEPHTFIPDFELVTHDKHTVHHDQVLPKVQDAIRQIEDPTGYLNIKNSVTIAAEPIPPSRPNANPKAVTGVAIWDDVDPDSNNYSIYVAGLSNGWSQTDNPLGADKEPIVRRKTLELDFKRLGDRYNMFSEEIHFNGPYKWIYRASELSAAALTPAAPEDKDKK